MKDLFGKEINVGCSVLYAKSFELKHFEKAIVVESEDKFIKIEYIGAGSKLYEYAKLKKKGDKSKITETEKKIIITDILFDAADIDLLQAANKKFNKEMVQMATKLHNSLTRETLLKEEIEQLKAEVNKIHSRSDILDL